MKVEQIIYTSCRRGIDSSVSGFQNYSYSPGMAEWVKTDSIGVLQSYQPPRINNLPTLPTQEQAKNQYPRRQVFGKINGPHDLYGAAMCSYIGRDYPEGSVRGGNFISHILLVPVVMIDRYPCAYIDSPSFRTWMDVQLARDKESPQPLNAIEMEPNPEITIDAVSEFLNEQDNSEILGRLLQCLLLRKSGTVSRKLLIYDTSENFTMWVSALQMALPLRLALDFSFSFYEYDVIVAGVDVLRMTEGMRQGKNDADLAHHFVVDMELGTLPDVHDVPVNLDDLCDFLVTMLQYSPSNLQNFHDFLDAGSLSTADETLALAYALYQLISGSRFEANGDHVAFANLFIYANKYASDEQRMAFISQLMTLLGTQQLNEADLNTLETTIPQLVAEEAGLRQTLPQTLLSSLLQLFAVDGGSEQLFEQVLTVAHAVFEPLHRSIDAELFEAITRQADSVLQRSGSASIPWTLPRYVRLTMASIADALNGGQSLPVQGDAREQVQSLGTIHADAVNSIVGLIVDEADKAYQDTTVGLVLFDGIEQQASTQPELLELIGELILQRQPPETVLYDAVIRTIWPLFLEGNDTKRATTLASLTSSGLDDLAFNYIDSYANVLHDQPGTFYRFLAMVMPALPGDFYERFANAIAATCWRIADGSASGKIECLKCVLGIPGVSEQQVLSSINEISESIPTVAESSEDQGLVQELARICGTMNPPIQPPYRVALAQHLTRISQLADMLDQRRADPMAMRSLAATIQRDGKVINTERLSAYERSKYLQKTSEELVRIISHNESLIALQQTALRRDAGIVVQNVIIDICRTKKKDTFIIVLAYDTELLFGNHASPAISAKDFASQVAAALFDAGVKSTSLSKQIEDDGKFAKLQNRYVESVRHPFPTDAFAAMYKNVSRELEYKEEQKPSFLGKLFG